MEASSKHTVSDPHQESVTSLPRGRHGLSPEFVADNQRGRIMRAMADTVADRGYGESTVADAIKQAGVSRKTFYDHFKNKEDCFLATYDAVVDHLSTLAIQAYSAADTWTDGVRGSLGACLDFLSSEPALARIALVEILAAGPQALERYDKAVRRFIPLIEAGREESHFGSELPSKVSEEIIGGVGQALYLRVLEGNIAALSESLDDLLYFALVPFLGHDRALEVAFTSSQ
jgi:AcrR family transcriptional regulator